MRYIQNNIPNPNKVYSFALNNFVGGLNNKEQQPNENQCTSVMNMAFMPDGVMEKRRGTVPFDSKVLDKPVVWVDEFMPSNPDAPDDVNQLVRASKKEIWFDANLVRTFPEEKRVHGINHKGKYFFVDGSGLFAYGRFTDKAGTYVRIVGTATTNFILMEIVSPPEGFTPLDTSHKKGVTVLDYTNRKVWYEPCQNEIKDTFKEGNVVPKKPRFIVAREGRIYVAGDDKDNDTVAISDTGNPYYFPAVLPLQLPPNSDRIAGLAVYNDAVVVGRRLDIHAIIGDTNRTDAGLPIFKLKKLNAHFGFASQDSVVQAHNYLFFLGSDSNFYVLRNLEYSTDVLSTQIISQTVNIHGDPINVQKDDIWNSSATFYNDCYYVSVGDKILVYHYLHRAWTVYDQIGATCFYVLFNTLLFGAKNGKILMPSNDYLDEGKPYKALWRTKWLDMGDPNALKFFRDFFIVSRATKEYTSTVNMKFEVDYQDVDKEVDVMTAYSIYGKSVWGDYYINRDINTSRPFQIFRRGRTIRITFWNSETVSREVATVADLEAINPLVMGMIVRVTADNKYYILEPDGWRIWDSAEFNQGMCLLQLSGEYEFKWKR